MLVLFSNLCNAENISNNLLRSHPCAARNDMYFFSLFFVFMLYKNVSSTALQDLEERTCSVCVKTFIRKEHFKRHWLERHGDKVSEQYECQHCGKKFKRRYHLTRHERNSCTCLKVPKFSCKICQAEFPTEEDFTYHLNSFHASEMTF